MTNKIGHRRARSGAGPPGSGPILYARQRRTPDYLSSRGYFPRQGAFSPRVRSVAIRRQLFSLTREAYTPDHGHETAEQARDHNTAKERTPQGVKKSIETGKGRHQSKKHVHLQYERPGILARFTCRSIMQKP